jgi:hypothetical protein
MPHDVVDVVAELHALADASAEALTRLRDGDEAAVADMIERRERLLLLLPDGTLEARTALAEAALRALALDVEIVAALRARQAEVGHQLERLRHGRQSLQSYGASRQGSAIYVERFS